MNLKKMNSRSSLLLRKSQRQLRSHCRHRSTQLRIESLERRTMLASDVAVAENTAWASDPSASAPTASAPPAEVSPAEASTLLFGPFEQQIQVATHSSSSSGYDTVVSNGPSANRVDMVILGDGYTASEVNTTYVTHVNNMLEYMFNAGQDPFPRYANFFNVHRVNTISNESGADKAPENIFVDTALDARYYCANIERLICIDNTKANAAKNTALAGAGFSSEMDFVTVNDAKYGGSGGTYAVFAGGNSAANELALHEVAHSFDNLADEYGGSPLYTGSEPSEVNVTTDPSGAKWDHWIGYEQPVIGTIDVYQGGRYFNDGIYRPSNNSKMRSLGRPFDAISREKIILDIYDLVDPIDDWQDNSVPIQSTEPELWVQMIDADVQDIEWTVDGLIVPGATEGQFSPTEFGFGPGSYTVAAKVTDNTDWVRQQTETLTQTVQWSVNILSPPEVTSIVLNDGATSRSQLTSVAVTLDSDVLVSESSFSLQNRVTNEIVALEVDTSFSNGETSVVLSFLPGPSVVTRGAGQLHSLANGTYELTVIAESVVDRSSGSTMVADHVYGDLASDLFFRQFGDRDGDRDVDARDHSRFKPTFLKSFADAQYDAELDYEGDGDVDSRDYANFRQQLFKTMSHG